MRFALVSGLFVAAVASAVPLAAADGTPTFTKDVAPIFYKSCIECHRATMFAPMSLTSYEDARPWLRSIKQRVTARTMPPWGSDMPHGVLSNDPRLTDQEIQTIVSWIDGGAPKGSPADMPKMPALAEGWTIGKPDAVYSMTEDYKIPAAGTIEYLYIRIPVNLPEDRWYTAVEIKPSARAHVHHIIAYVREPGSTWLKDIKLGIPFIPEKPKPDAKEDTSALPSDFLVAYAPGQPPEAFEPGIAKLVKAGSDIILQVHYTTDGKASTDMTRVGLVFAKEPPAKRVMTFSATNGKFRIPAGDPNHRVDAEFELGADVVLHGLHPHMHARGKDFIYHVRYPDGRRETLLSVPNYSFAWQLWYNLEKPIFLPKGTVFECTAHYDNSPNNKNNPDPTKDVIWGDQSWDEMMVGFFNLVFDAKMDEKLVIAK
jgi:hypothetical protein